MIAVDRYKSRKSFVLALSGLAIAIVLPLLPTGRWIAPGNSIAALLTREAVWWSYAAVVIAWLRYAEGLPLSSIGLRRPTWKTFLFALLGAAALLAVFVIHFGVIVPVFHLNASAAGAERQLILRTPYWYRILLVLRAAVVEEILFRGYIIEKVRQLTGSPVLAIALSVATFTYAHLAGWGIVHLIPVFGGAMIFALLYVWRRDLPCNMFAHFVTDAAGFFT